ncbi:maleylpyruvate isomerase family mycothiol-dependent enzyme [Mycobacterium vicinigordonae]|uniref:Maleylpyruvate isomerase family mycothiol-dependent enzyme n=1 Tax=Mycobacterium vicinigordonae TaxID=1719132 RepID=A0A7D6E6Q2_9MYCO|nr:maleylpyruvate isomerase family mycothiol-dependent enzyme [Mycobacterium vicinigordonae]QLL08023.1 maleylpyruvate isomerase family mycothiol-dependent enzyme [Mycobacterium vicinigordonae]
MDYAAAYLEQTRAFGELIRAADPSTPVPTCPGWTLDQLFRHVGRGDRWAAQIVRDRRDSFLEFRSVDDGAPPSGRDDAIAWLNGGAELLVDAVAATGPQTPVWTFLGTRPAGWWIRRRLHENVVHRADAELAVGGDFGVDPELAADAIDEFLERIVIRAGKDGAPLPLEGGDTLHLHATDPGLGQAGEWTIAVQETAITWSHLHGKGTAALRGSAAELLLAITRRVSLADTAIELFGDEQVWRRWLDRTPL